MFNYDFMILDPNDEVNSLESIKEEAEELP